MFMPHEQLNICSLTPSPRHSGRINSQLQRPVIPSKRSKPRNPRLLLTFIYKFRAHTFSQSDQSNPVVIYVIRNVVCPNAAWR